MTTIHHWAAVIAVSFALLVFLLLAVSALVVNGAQGPAKRAKRAPLVPGVAATLDERASGQERGLHRLPPTVSTRTDG